MCTHTHTQIHTYKVFQQCQMFKVVRSHSCGKQHLRLLFLGWTISLSTNPVLKANSALWEFLNSFKNQRYFLFTSHCLLPLTPHPPFSKPKPPFTPLVVYLRIMSPDPPVQLPFLPNHKLTRLMSLYFTKAIHSGHICQTGSLYVSLYACFHSRE